MARMPGAIWQGEHGSKPMDRYDIVCVHTIVGFAPAHAAHFSVRANGEILQSRDTSLRSGANLEGNHRVIAIENEDHGSAFGSWNTGDGHAVPDFTALQVEANARIVAWAHQTHGIPLVPNPNSRPTSRGVGYHRQGIDGNFLADGYAYGGRVSGGELWTTSPGKVCPGDRRISRVPQIINRAIAIAGGDDMTPEEHEWLRRLDFAFNNESATPFSERAEITKRLRTVDGRTVAIQNTVNSLANIDEDALATDIANKVLAGLPDPVPGGLTQQDVVDGVKQALTESPLVPIASPVPPPA